MVNVTAAIMHKSERIADTKQRSELLKDSACGIVRSWNRVSWEREGDPEGITGDLELRRLLVFFGNGRGILR